MNAAQVTKLHEGAACQACSGQGVYTHGCSRYVCHVCRGRGFVVGGVRSGAAGAGVPSEVGNLPTKGGESKLRRLLVFLVVFALLPAVLAGCGFAGGMAAGAAFVAPASWAFGFWSHDKLVAPKPEAPPPPKPEPEEWEQLEQADRAAGEAAVRS